jgi:hypothetical protein
MGWRLAPTEGVAMAETIKLCERIVSDIETRARIEALRAHARELAELELRCTRVAAGLVRNGGRS